jgi:hypothetical protein
MRHIDSIKAPFPRFCAAVALVAALYSTPLHAAVSDELVAHEHATRLSPSAAESVELASDGDDLRNGSVRYTCPMHPEVISEAPGRCPHCGMKLVEREAAPEAWWQP